MHDQDIFEHKDYVERRPFDGEVHACTFEHCDFTDSELGGVAFVDCTFDECNLSMADLENTRLQGVHFEDCKLTGVDFGACSDFAFSVSFAGCNLYFASFWGKEMPKTEFSGCTLEQANFAEADLTKAVFADCDLSQTTFSQTNLESADLREAHNFSIDPEVNQLRGAKFSRSALEGLLYKYELDVE